MYSVSGGYRHCTIQCVCAFTNASLSSDHKVKTKTIVKPEEKKNKRK